MVNSLLDIPHPTWKELLISSEVLIILYPLHTVMRKVDKETRRIRKTLIRRHVQHHKGRYAHCKCATDPKIVLGPPSHLDQVVAAEPDYLFEP